MPAPQGSGRRLSPVTLTILLFSLSVVIFVGTLALLASWLREPAPESAGAAPVPGLLTLPEESETLEGRIRAARAAARKREIRIFFTTDGLQLEPQVRQMSEYLEPYQRLHRVLKELLMGPPSDFSHSPVPYGTRLRAAYIREETAVVDLSEEILGRPDGGPMAELLCVYAIVNTVIENVPSVKKVQLLVEGRSAPVLWDQVDLTAPLGADVSLIRY